MNLNRPRPSPPTGGTATARPKASGGAESAKSGGPQATVELTRGELHKTRELLEGVMTLAAHGLLYRVGQVLGERLVEDAKRRGGGLQDAACALLVERHWMAEARFFPQKVQVVGSIEVKEGVEPTCHILRGQLQRVVAEESGPVTLKEESCASQGGESCVFLIVKGGRAP